MFSKVKSRLYRDDRPEAATKLCTELKSTLENAPVGDDPEIWNWFCDKMAYFKEMGLDRCQYTELCLHVIQNCHGQYASHFGDFLKITKSVSYITAACEQLLLEHGPEAAKMAADPCLAYLKEHCQLYAQGQLCFSCMEEAVVYAAEHGDNGENRAQDDYAGFFLCFAGILLWTSCYEDLGRDDRQNIEFCLEHAENLSPCNPSLWELKATVCREADQKEYLKCIEKALYYSVAAGAVTGLGKVYENLAAFYSSRNYALAEALCRLSSKYGGNPERVKSILSGCEFDCFPDAELAVHQAGIQVGYSSLARMAQEKADEFRKREGIGEKANNKCKVILTASDTNYQYEVRDPMTILGRSSAMSEYLRQKPTVSRIHARLVMEDDLLFVTDMDALNGTYVNGIRIGNRRQVLHEGDELRLGSSSERGARFTMKTLK